MELANIESNVKRVVQEQFGLSEKEISNDKKLVADLGADSLDLVELVMAIEDEFTIEIEDEAGEACVSVQDVIDLVAKKVTK